MGCGVFARFTPVGLRRWCALVAMICCGALGLSIDREVGAGYVTEFYACYSARLCEGELCLRWDRRCEPPWLVPDGGLSFRLSPSSGCRLAWRPYHAQCTGCGPGDYEALNIPLWQPAAASLIFLAYAHGLIRGLRRVDSGRCHVCGVDLVGRGPREHCPSCGCKPSARAGLSCRACGYDLSGLGRGWGGRCRCPECGATTLRPAR